MEEEQTYIDNIADLITFLNNPSKAQSVSNLRIWLGHENGNYVIPDGIGSLISLRKLEISNFSSAKLPDLSGLKNLNELDINLAKKLSEFPESLLKLQNLKSLTLNRIGMKPILKIPDNLNPLTGLKKLIINAEANYTKVKAPLPDSLSTLPALLELDISDSYGITDISVLKKMKKLQKLKMSTMMSLEDFNPVSELENLTELDLSFNEMNTIKPLLSLKKLKVLKLKCCRSIKNIEGISALHELKKLDLSSTGVKDLSPLEKNIKLTELDVANSKLDDHGKNKTVEALMPLLGNPVLKKVITFEVSQKEWKQRYEISSIFKKTSGSPGEILTALEHKRESHKQSFKSKEQKQCLEKVVQFDSPENVKLYTGKMIETYKLFQKEMDEGYLSKIEFNFFQGGDDYEAMADGFNDDDEELIEQTGGFSLYPIIQISNECVKDESLKIEIEDFVFSCFYVMIHKAIAASVKEPSFQKLNKNKVMDFFMIPHDESPVLVYRYNK